MVLRGMQAAENVCEDLTPAVRLRLLGALYKRPLGVFFLPKPPKDFAALKDFRRLPGEVAGVLSPALKFGP